MPKTTEQAQEKSSTKAIAVRAGAAFGPKKVESALPFTDPNRYAVSDDGVYLTQTDAGWHVEGKPGELIKGWYTRLDCGSRYHYVDGRFNDDGLNPAVVFPNNRGFMHYKQGKQHKDEGWAVDMVTTFGDKRQVKFINGERHAVGEAAEIVIREDGMQFIGWYQNNQLHREGAAAYTIINAEGEIISEEYYLQGELHRTNGPAVIAKKYTEYRQEGELHRLDGPALITTRGEEYYIQGRPSSRQEVAAAYIQNRNETIGKAKKSDILAVDPEEKKKSMSANILNWKKDQEKSAPRKKPGM